MYPVKDTRKGKGRRMIAVIVIAVLALSFSLLILFRINRFQLKLRPLEDVTLEYGSSWQDPGAQGCLCGTRFFKNGIPVNVEVTVEGSVDTSRIGAYTLCYRAQLWGQEAVTVRTVTVVDTTAPMITLEGETSLEVERGKTPQEPGFTARDDYDGDLTGRVAAVVDGDVIRYTVADNSGNVACVERKILWKDDDKPRIILTGDSTIYRNAGHTFVDPGFSAEDYTDGDITALVEVEGEANGYRAGTYTLTYSVTDSNGNFAQVQRTVVVQAVPQPEIVVPEEKVIYLTFDDGPGPYTQALLDVLEKYDVQVTFFVVDNEYAPLISQMAAQGHAIGIHSMSHDYQKIYASEEAFFNELYGMQEIIYQYAGYYTTLVRFPGGSSNTISSFNEGIMTRLSASLTDAGFQYYDWNVDSNDAGGAKDAETVFTNVTCYVEGKRYSIVLQHDIKDFSVEAVEQIIIWGLENGYTFKKLDPTSPNCHHRISN